MPAECSIDPDDLYGVEDVTWEWLDMPPPPLLSIQMRMTLRYKNI